MQIDEFKEALTHYDADGNGQISSKELPMGANLWMMYAVVNKAEFEIKFFLYENFCQFMPDHIVTFLLYNEDGDCTITKELRTAMQSLGLFYSEAEVHDLVYQKDASGKKACVFNV